MPVWAAIMLGLAVAGAIFLLVTAASNEPAHRASDLPRVPQRVLDHEAQKAQWEQIWNTGADPQWTDQLGWIPTPVHPDDWKGRS